MATQTTALVVGGGATGAGVARDLALRGVDVTLVERGGLSSGASGHSHGLLHSGARYADDDPVGATECIEENRILRRIGGACVHDTGGLFVQVSGDDAEYFEEKVASCDDLGIATEVFDGDEARAIVPGLAEDVERAVRVPDAVVSPSRLVAANAADASEHGGTVLTDAPVEDVQTDGGRVTGVDVGGAVDERFEPEFVVNAAGAWAGEVAAMAGLSVEMEPTRGVMVAVEHDALDPVLNRCRPPDDGDIVVAHPDEAVLGTTSVGVDDPDDYPTASWEVERTVAECARMLPPVADADVARTWWGVRPLYAPDEAERDGRGVSRGFFLLDHAEDGVENAASIVGGKLTTYRAMAEATADLVAERVGSAADCVTDERRLPGADDPGRLDEFVATYDGQGESDVDVVGAGTGGD